MAILETLLQIAAATAFGYLVALGALLDRRGYRWFPGAPFAVGAAAAGVGVGMFALSLPGVHHFWLAALASAVLLGQVRAGSEIVRTALLAIYLGTWASAADNLDALAVGLMLAALLVLGVAQAVARRRGGAIATLADERWAWFLVISFYVFMVELDLGLVAAAYAFQSSRRSFDDDASRAKLRSWGIKKQLRG